MDGYLLPAFLTGFAHHKMRQRMWAQRQEMMASFDDLLASLIKYGEMRGWKTHFTKAGFIVISG